MLTAQQIAYACLEYIGEYSLTLTQHTGTTSTAVYRALVRSFNLALQELFELNPALFKREVGVTIAAPETGTVTVTQGSRNLSATTLTGGMDGAAIVIAGQTEWNVLNTEGATKKLVFPYTGSSGTKAATLYGDAVLLDTAYSRPLGPVWLADIRELSPLNGKPEFIGYDPRQDLSSDWGRYPFGVTRFPTGRHIGQPEAFLVDTHRLEAGISQVRIWLTPVPDQQYSLRFDAGVRPIAVVAADFGEDDDDPEHFFGIPAGLDERFLQPLVLYHWSTSAFFVNDEKRRELKESYQSVLPEIEAWKLQPQTGSHIVQWGGWRG